MSSLIQNLQDLIHTFEQRYNETTEIEEETLELRAIKHDYNNTLQVIISNIELGRYSNMSVYLKRLRTYIDLLDEFSTQNDIHCTIPELFDNAYTFFLESLICGHGNIKSFKFNYYGNIKVSRFYFRRVIDNLVKNAVEASNIGQVIQLSTDSVELSSELNRIPLGKYFRLRVADRGEGISEENLPNIFELGFTTKPNGSGIGLHNVKKIVDNHNGYIMIKPNLFSGITFEIYLPDNISMARQ